MKFIVSALLIFISSIVLAKPITLVVGFAPGGSSDLFARLVAEKLSYNTGNRVTVQNVSGAGGVIAHSKVATGPSDGSVILLASVGPLTVSPNVIDVSYDPIQDFLPISMGAELPNILVVPKSLGVNNLKEFIALAKKRGNISYGSSGIYSSTHVAGELLQKRANVKLLHVPYKGGSAALIDVVAGRISSAIISPFTAEPFIRRGELVGIAVTSKERMLMLPNIPTIAEQGFVGFDATNWYAFVAHKDVAENTIKQLNKDIGVVLKDPEIQEKLIMHGLTVKYSSSSWLKQYITQELSLSKQIFN
jgi:tripartite-type tricarboxylate transporter receptor subunit TctC